LPRRSMVTPTGERGTWRPRRLPLTSRSRRCLRTRPPTHDAVAARPPRRPRLSAPPNSAQTARSKPDGWHPQRKSPRLPGRRTGSRTSPPGRSPSPGARDRASVTAGWSAGRWSGQASMTPRSSPSSRPPGKRRATTWRSPGTLPRTRRRRPTILGRPAGVRAVRATLALLECTAPPAVTVEHHVAEDYLEDDVEATRIWILASTGPYRDKSAILRYLDRTAVTDLPARIFPWAGSAAWLVDRTDQAIELLQATRRRMQAPGVRGASGGVLSSLGWAYLDAG